MNTFVLLRNLNCISALLFYVSLFFLALSAYKRTKQKGFVCWGFAALGSVLNSPLPFQSSGLGRHRGDSAFFSDLFHGLWIVNHILMLVGLILVIRGYITLFNARGATGGNPPANAEGDAENRWP